MKMASHHRSRHTYQIGYLKRSTGGYEQHLINWVGFHFSIPLSSLAATAAAKEGLADGSTELKRHLHACYLDTCPAKPSAWRNWALELLQAAYQEQIDVDTQSRIGGSHSQRCLTIEYLLIQTTPPAWYIGMHNWTRWGKLVPHIEISCMLTVVSGANAGWIMPLTNKQVSHQTICKT